MNTPVFPALRPAPGISAPEASAIEPTGELTQPVTALRVQVFPHTGHYTIPQGAEKVTNTVTLTSTGSCQTGPVGGALAPAANTLTFTYATLTAPVQVACSSPVTIERGAGLTSYRYDGTFEVEQGGSQQVRVVNILPLEDYLRGVIPAEVPSSWPSETLQAQAVASRTYAMYEREHHVSVEGLAPDVDVDDTVLSQAYLGLTAAVPSSDTAIAETANEVIYYNHDVIASFFSADSGGYTEDAQNVFGPTAQAYCQAKPEAYPLSLEPAPWTETYTQARLTTLLQESGLAKVGNPITAVTINSTFRSGRVNQLSLEYADGTSRKITGSQLAGALSLRSTLYTVEASAGPVFTITGRGFGHGVGMSQDGAHILVESMNWTHDQILSFYYTDVTLCHLGVDCQ